MAGSLMTAERALEVLQDTKKTISAPQRQRIAGLLHRVIDAYNADIGLKVGMARPQVETLVWMDIRAALVAAKDHGHSPDLDELDCALLIQLMTDPWRIAVTDACAAVFLDWDEKDPRGTLQRLLQVESEIALDPAVSAPAAALVRQGAGGAASGLVEMLTWVPVTERLPDADLTVNIALELSGNVGGADFDGEPTFLGYWDGERWRDTSGTTVNVTHWAHMLRGPVRVAQGSPS